MFKARVLTVTEKCTLIVEVKLPFDITIKREVGLTGMKIKRTEENKTILSEEVRFRAIQVEVENEGNGKYSVTIFKDGINFNDILVEKLITTASHSDEAP